MALNIPVLYRSEVAGASPKSRRANYPRPGSTTGCCERTFASSTRFPGRRRGQGPPSTTVAGGSHSTSSAACRFSDSPYQSGVEVCGPMLMPAAASRASVAASGAPSHHTGGGSTGSGFPSGHPESLLVHRAVVEPAHADQVGQPGLAAVRPVLDVVGVATPRFAVRKPALAAVPAQQRSAQRARDGARPAPDVQHLSTGAEQQHHDAGIAGHAPRRLPVQVQPARLLDDSLTGVQVCPQLERFRGNVSRSDCRLLRR